jgi:ABC-type Fe3+-siderophore transport system permease subunit
VVTAGIVIVLLAAAVHLTQGTSAVDAAGLLRLALGQGNLDAVTQMAPVVALAGTGGTGAMIVAGHLDLLALGDDAATVLGVHVQRIRVAVVLLAGADRGCHRHRRRRHRGHAGR